MIARNISFLLIVLMIVWIGCEYTTDGVELPYEERLVVWGRCDDSGADFTFERTLRLGEDRVEYSPRLNDVNAYIKHEHGIVEVPLDTAGGNHGFYRSQVLFAPGEQLELFAEWHGKKITAKTRRPATPQVESFRAYLDSSVQPTMLVCEGTFVPLYDELYTSWIDIYISPWDTTQYIRIPQERRTYLRVNDAAPDGRIHVSERYRNAPSLPDSITIEVLALDKAYYDYWVSQGDPGSSGFPRSSLFSGAFRSNVKGDGVGVVWGTTSNRKVLRFH